MRASCPSSATFLSNQVDADHIGRWTHTWPPTGSPPSGIRTYRALLGLILNAAVTDGYLPHAPALPSPHIGHPARPVRSGSPESSFTGLPMPSSRGTGPSF